jgi:hypothetical protein
LSGCNTADRASVAMASATETVFIEIYLVFLLVGTHANSS